MFEKVAFWIKGVIERMFGYSQLKSIVGQNITMSQPMIDAVSLWKRMLYGSADWIDESKGITSLRLEEGICREFADVTLVEMDASINLQALDAIFQEALRDLNENLQDGLALGSFVMKPLGNGMAEYVSADKFVPVSFGDDGKPDDMLFFTRKRMDENNFYTRVERHYFNLNHDLVIESKCYHSNSENTLGRPCPLTAVYEWAEIAPEPITYPGMKQNDYGYFRVPLKNRVDGSPCGVSIYSGAVQAIRRADAQYGRLDWEYRSGERAVHVDERALRHKEGRTKLPEGMQRLYRGLNLDQSGGELYKEYSPTMRDEAYLRGLEKAYRNVEFIVGLAYGDLSDVSEVEKTATEIKAAKQRKYNRVGAIQKNLKACLTDFVDALAFYEELYTANYEFACTFNDSILTDEEGEREQDRKDVAMGVMGLAEYRAKWYQEDEETAKANLPEQSSSVLT
ncbi:MAG: phage capsid protein [Lachnospiraceae bacterium]|nr:phage capsid protein [Lachnospiraceae bacterium]